MRTLLTLLALGVASPLLAADPFEFKDGDRVVFLGSTLIEREQKYGYWELALTLKNADKNVTFRNLGWSGDTVWGEARNGFDASPKGYERLVQVTKDAKPTVIVICYGHNESFEGKAGVPKFTKQLEKLLDALAPTKARIVVMAPTPFFRGGPVTDPASRNKNLELYRDWMNIVAGKRDVEFYDLFTELSRLPSHIGPLADVGPLTDNGLHLTETGYEFTSQYLMRGERERVMLKFLTDVTTSADNLSTLRKKIIEKNQLVFHQWRPQNETYLFLFRKHEQGNNAKDIPAFDPLIEKAEKEIQESRKSILEMKKVLSKPK